MQWLGIVELDPIKRPNEPLHVTRQVQFDIARLAGIRVSIRALEVGISEHAPWTTAQSSAGIVEVGARIIHPHVIVGAYSVRALAGGGISIMP
jgi:hypothetical protein